MGSKGGRGLGLSTLPPSCADCLEIWEPQTIGALGATRGPYRDSFTFTARRKFPPCSKTHSPVQLLASKCEV